eukprot:comp23911_c1_seq1/m.42133 comp23911_c1_seq1/g.42133  ORF comp23911_c1_seq1/g.42133 comp23911_c1_seq1/m.42133 type:complete len:337 (-) comp23911_c1_seq1:5645-6655(-)
MHSPKVKTKLGQRPTIELLPETFTVTSSATHGFAASLGLPTSPLVARAQPKTARPHSTVPGSLEDEVKEKPKVLRSEAVKVDFENVLESSKSTLQSDPHKRLLVFPDDDLQVEKTNRVFRVAKNAPGVANTLASNTPRYVNEILSAHDNSYVSVVETYLPYAHTAPKEGGRYFADFHKLPVEQYEIDEKEPGSLLSPATPTSPSTKKKALDALFESTLERQPSTSSNASATSSLSTAEEYLIARFENEVPDDTTMELLEPKVPDDHAKVPRLSLLDVYPNVGRGEWTPDLPGKKSSAGLLLSASSDQLFRLKLDVLSLTLKLPNEVEPFFSVHVPV